MDDKPVIEHEKEAEPEESAIWLLLTVGAAVVLQQIPFEVTVAPPSEVTRPPPIALFEVMPFTAAVTIIGCTFVVHPIKSSNIEIDNTKLRLLVLLQVFIIGYYIYRINLCS